MEPQVRNRVNKALGQFLHKCEAMCSLILLLLIWAFSDRQKSAASAASRLASFATANLALTSFNPHSRPPGSQYNGLIYAH